MKLRANNCVYVRDNTLPTRTRVINPGDVFDIDDDSGARLVKAGVAVVVEVAAPESDPEPGPGPVTEPSADPTPAPAPAPVSAPAQARRAGGRSKTDARVAEDLI